MAQVIVLGGGGAVGRVASKTLAGHDAFSKVVVADFNPEKARTLLSEVGSSKISFEWFDAQDPQSIKEAIKGSDVVLNCVGPFYSTVKPILKAVIESGINYVDICDDVDVTLGILEMDAQAKEAGVSALIGMGISPGVTNLLGKLAADQLLDEVYSIDIFHAHGGEPMEGEGVIGHRFHCMSIDIPMYLNGELKQVDFFGDDGKALRQTFEFPILGEVPLFPYPHPEQLTMPNYIKLRQVTNKGSVLPREYFELTKELCRLGMGSREPLEVKGQSVIPYDFAVAYILKERDRILKETDFGEQRGCCSVVAKGKKEGKDREYRFHLASRSQALGEGTGIPAAMGAILMNQGKVKGPGVMPPEACLDPMEFVALQPEVMELNAKKSGGDSFGGIIVQSIDENGDITELDI